MTSHLVGLSLHLSYYTHLKFEIQWRHTYALIITKLVDT